MKELINSRPAIQEILKEFLQAERNSGIYTNGTVDIQKGMKNTLSGNDTGK